jgi:ribose transport system permease protein
MRPHSNWLYSLIKSREAGIVIALILMLGVFYAINPRMLILANIQAIFRASAFVGIMSIGVTWILISGSIDLSIGAVAGMASIITSYLIVKQGYPIFVSVIAGLVSGGLFGMMNYWLVYTMKIPAFLATIGTMYIGKGIALFISNGFQIYPLPAVVGEWGTAMPLGTSWHFWIFVILVIISEFVLFQTVYGLEVRATGSDRNIAIKTEVNVKKINLTTFVTIGTLSALSGILLMTRIIAGNSEIGAGWELSAIAASAIGGVSLFGHDGSFIGMFLGVMALQIIQNGLIVIGVSPYLNTVVVGIILVLTAAIDWQRKTTLDL